ncbi:hypothetical protein [Myroides marinus]|uniref:hypothetical protein n=1 Tax=Myroides marinus TaxID=703342 RepID=UPI002578E4F8|nr:hypothetical protein [Myroides marinus]MDM1354581.1 hypothetical protein [Myroides marinus]
MKSKYLYIKSFHSILLMVIALLMNVTLIFGQGNINSTKITDGTVNTTPNTPAANYSILELETSSKGFLLPRMSTEERNKIVIDNKVRGNGLAIYNTDEDCINYWSRGAGLVEGEGKWLSVCGSLPPATMEMLNCDKTVLNASGQTMLTQGRSLRDTDILYVSINVIHSGSYSISAISDNGYSFSKTGVFETPGAYTVALEGFGTPMRENETPGDLLTFSLNGKKNTKCINSRIKVKSSEIDFSIVSASSVNWLSYKSVALTGDTNVIDVTVSVKTAGYWRIQGDESLNGITLNGSGEFTQEDVGKNKVVQVYAQGVPLAKGSNTFKLVSNSKNNKTSNVSIVIITEEAEFEFACNDMGKFVINGEFQEDTPLLRANSVTIPIKVLKPGPITIKLNGKFEGANGTIAFEAKDVFLGKMGDVQMVNFIPESKTVPAKATAISFTSVVPASVVLCSSFPQIPVKERSKIYSVNCGIVKTTGTYVIGQPLEQGKDGLIVRVTVGYADTFNIKTNTVNGVSFSKTGTFSDVDRANGTKDITLDGVGTPTKGDNFKFEITTYASDNSIYHTCEATVNFRGPTINVLAVGYDSYAPTGRNSSKAPNAIIQNSNLFGPQGIVKVDQIVIFKNNIVYRFPADLRGYLKANKIDIVIFGYPTRYDQSEMEALRDFVKIDKGVVILADELNMNGSKQSTDMLVSALQNGIAVNSTNGSEAFTMVNHVLASANNDILIKDTGFGSLANRHTGNDAGGNGWYYKNLDPNSYVPLIASNKDASWISCFRHKDLGFVFIGDGGAFAGSEGGYRSLTIWPAAYSNSGTLFGKDYADRGTRYSVYNSILYANMIKWGIEYVMKNKDRQ